MERETAFHSGLVIKALHVVAASAIIASCLLQVAVVALRAAGIGLLWGQELVVALGAVAILTGSASAFAHDRLVRIDVLSASRSLGTKRWIDCAGSQLFMLPFALCLVWFGWDYAMDSWRISEGSAEVSGLPGRFTLKFLIPLFAIGLLLAAFMRWQKR